MILLPPFFLFFFFASCVLIWIIDILFSDWARDWDLQRATGLMEAGDAGNGSAAAAQIKGSGDDASCKPLPPCCVKAKAGVPESEAKCHDTVVSGWFTEPRSHFGTLKIQNRWLFGNYSYGQCMFFVKFWYIVQTDVCAGKTSKVQYYNNPMWPGIFSLFCPTNGLTMIFFFKHVCVHTQSHYNNMLNIDYDIMI